MFYYSEKRCSIHELLSKFVVIRFGGVEGVDHGVCYAFTVSCFQILTCKAKADHRMFVKI